MLEIQNNVTKVRVLILSIFSILIKISSFLGKTTTQIHLLDILLECYDLIFTEKLSNLIEEIIDINNEINLKDYYTKFLGTSNNKYDTGNKT